MTAVTGRWVTADGNPAEGYIRFALHPSAVSSSGEQVTCAPVYGILVDGALDIDLIPDSDLAVDGTAVYRVDEFITDCRRSWWLVITGEDPVDLPSRYPGDTVGDVAVVPVPGPQGPEGERGPQGVPGQDGQDGADGLSAQWEQAATWAALPSTGNWPGRRVRVLDGLGLCLAVWAGSWRVDEQSDTGWLRLSAPPGWDDSVYGMQVRRLGGLVVGALRLTTDGTGHTVLWTVPVGWRGQNIWGTYGMLLSSSAAGATVPIGNGNSWASWYISPQPQAGTTLSGTFNYSTTDPWPTTPPA